MFDIEKIREDFKKIIMMNFDTTKKALEKFTDYTFECWFNNKKRFIDAFGGELTYQTKEKISIELTQVQKAKRKMSFINDVERKLITYLHIDEFIERYPAFKFFMSHIDAEDFLDNHVTYDYNEKIPKGARISKAFKIIFKDCLSEEQITSIQNLYSRYVQESKLTGYLVLSVHPLDFLSVSENTYDWRSCHSLDGDYALGNIQYMTDKVTFIGYVLSDNTLYKLPNFPEDVKWNSKISRQLFFLHDEKNVLLCGRPYPNFNYELMNSFVSLIGEKLMGHDPDLALYENNELEYPISDRLMINRNISPLYYNDLVDSSCYEPYVYMNYNLYYDIKEERPMDYYPHFYIGNDIPCLECGKFSAHYLNGRCVDCYDRDDEDYVCCAPFDF